LRPGGTIKWKVEYYRLGRSESVMWQANTSKIVASVVSVKERWVDPHEQVLNVLIACW
jgi:hypothetical protein